ncbi:MAG: glycosyltransferase family 4 protein [Deltaproteobacteria bacterium]
MPLRIAAVAYTHYESDPRVKREAEALAARGDDVTVFALASEGRPAEATENGVKVVRLAMPRYRGGAAAQYVASYGAFMARVHLPLIAAHLKARFDVVHIHTMPDAMVFCALVPRLSGAKVVLDMHDLMPDLFRVKFEGRVGDAVGTALELVQQAATTFADAVIAVHENQYELLLDAGVPAHKLAIVMNAADPTLFPPRKKEPRVKDEVRVIYHGTVLHRYGCDLAVRAFAKAHAQEPKLTMRMLGGGDYVGDVRALADSLGLAEPAFSMSGAHVPLEEIAAAIRDAHIGLIPNRDDHVDSVLPTKLLEYVAVGIPAVAANTRTIGRFFDGDTVELFEVGDVDAMAEALVRLARDGARRKALVAAGRAWEAEYGWDVNRQHLFRTMDALCYEKIAAERKARQKAKEGKKTGTIQTPAK